MGESVVESLDDYIAEMDDAQAWPTLFGKLLQIAAKNMSPCGAAKEGENKTRNRYRDVLAADCSRVILSVDDEESNYINANHVVVVEVDRRYILTQGPLPHTASHFWQMVWEQNSKGIAMVNRVIEKGVRKCHQYFPDGTHTPDGPLNVMTFEPFRITFVESDDRGGFVINKLSVEHMEKEEPAREVLHFHYKKWPDFHLPDTAEDFLDYLWAIREAGCLSNDVGSLVVHCSAGIGRSGTLVLVDACLREIELRGDLKGDQIEAFLLGMRRLRFGLVQTPEQLRFAFLAIAEGIERVNVTTTTAAVSEEAAAPVPDEINPESKAITIAEVPTVVTTPSHDSVTVTAVSAATAEEPASAAAAAASEGATGVSDESVEAIAQPPCKRPAVEEPAVDDQPPPKRSLNSLGQTEGRGCVVLANASDDHQPSGLGLQPAFSPSASNPTQPSGVRPRVGARNAELTDKVGAMQQRQREQEASKSASSAFPAWGGYVVWPVVAAVVAGGAYLAYRRFLA